MGGVHASGTTTKKVEKRCIKVFQ